MTKFNVRFCRLLIKVIFIPCIFPLTLQASEQVSESIKGDKYSLVPENELIGLRHRKISVLKPTQMIETKDKPMKNVQQNLVSVENDSLNQYGESWWKLDISKQIFYDHEDLMEKALSLPDKVIEQSLHKLAQYKDFNKKKYDFLLQGRDNIHANYVYAFILEKNISQAHIVYPSRYSAYAESNRWYVRLYLKLKSYNDEVWIAKVDQAMSRMVPLLRDSLYTRTTHTTIKTAGK